MTFWERLHHAMSTTVREKPPDILHRQHRERDYYTRVQSRTERVSERDWSGAEWGGRSAAGSRWSGGREI